VREPSEFIFSMLSSLPEQVSVPEKTETVNPEPAIEEGNAAAMEFAGCEPTSIAFHLAAKVAQAEAKAKGEEITYIEACRRAESK
jgi:hypothetical protein